MQLIQYLTIARRNLTRRKGSAILNILGLSIGLAGCLVIFLIEQHEWSYDRYHRHAAQLFQLVKDTKTSAGDEYHRSIPFEMTKALRHDCRKVLGASIANIVYLFSREFTVLIAIAFLIAAPPGSR